MPLCAFTALMSLAFTERELVTSPTRKPIDASEFNNPFTLVSETVARRLSAMPVNVTITSLVLPPLIACDTLPSVVALDATEVTVLLKRNTI